LTKGEYLIQANLNKGFQRWLQYGYSTSKALLFMFCKRKEEYFTVVYSSFRLKISKIKNSEAKHKMEIFRRRQLTN